MRQIQENYIDAGIVRFGLVHFVVLGPQAQLAAEASECASEQGSFWEYHDTIFANHGAFSLNEENLKMYASNLGLDSSTFNQCLESRKFSNLVQSDSNMAAGLGMRSTPSFLINGYQLIGAQPYESFEKAIETLLNNQ